MKLFAENSESAALKKFAGNLKADIEKSAASGADFYNLALSGGDTAKKLFEALLAEKIDWSRVRFYWVDERCVVPENDESNYKHAKEMLFDKAGIADSQVFRLRGEECPISEAQRYEKLVAAQVPEKNGFPVFDCVILGIGGDFHTASIFPGSMKLIDEPKDSYSVNTHPETGQWRMTMTGRTILNAKKIYVAVLGESKRKMFTKLLKLIVGGPDSTPASYILSRADDAEIFTDIKPE